MASSTKQPTCAERIEEHYASRMEDLHKLWSARMEGIEDVEDLGNLYDYGLSIDYVAPDTFKEQEEGYIRYQISWGGPSDEFRFYFSPSAHGYKPHRIEYVFMDWFDGATKTIHSGKDRQLLADIFEDWDEMEQVQAWIDASE